MGTTITIINTNNPAKQYLVKRYPSGNYYINQLIAGKVFYKRWTRDIKSWCLQLDSFKQSISFPINHFYKLYK